MQQNAAREAKRTKSGFCTELCTKGIFGKGPNSKIPLFYLVHPSGVEPETFGFVGKAGKRRKTHKTQCFKQFSTIADYRKACVEMPKNAGKTRTTLFQVCSSV